MKYIAGNIEDGLPNYSDNNLLEWTTELPTQEGWYWVSILYAEVKRHQFVLYIDNKQTFHDPKDWDDEHRTHILDYGKGTHWLGPLPIPDEPEAE